MTLSTLLWAVPIFFVVGLIIGVILQLAMPNYERGCMQIVFLVVIAVLAVVLVTMLLSVVRSFDPEPATEPTLRRIPIAILFAPFVLGALIGRLAKRKARVQRRQRVVAPVGSHHVPADLRAPIDRAAPPAHADPPDRSLPTPFGPGGRDVASPTHSDAPLLPPESPAPPPPPPPPQTRPPGPPSAPGF